MYTVIVTETNLETGVTFSTPYSYKNYRKALSKWFYELFYVSDTNPNSVVSVEIIGPNGEHMRSESFRHYDESDTEEAEE